jgi:hypothetical protein
MTTCPYCKLTAELVDLATVDEHRRKGNAWVCHPCNAWVACHPRSQKPMGRLANPELQEARHAAFEAFNTLWKTWGANRKSAYKWLAEQLGIDVASCDFYKFDIEQCNMAEDISNDFTPQFWYFE